MKILGSTKSEITKDENCENVPHYDPEVLYIEYGLLIKILNR